MQRRSSAIVQLRARQHRSRLTDSEDQLWARLRGCRLGVWFRRQVPVGRFIVDFLAPSAKLVVEVDGGYHSTRASADTRRDQQLARMGYRIVRIDAELVRLDPAKAIALIHAGLRVGQPHRHSSSSRTRNRPSISDGRRVLPRASPTHHDARRSEAWTKA